MLRLVDGKPGLGLGIGLGLGTRSDVHALGRRVSVPKILIVDDEPSIGRALGIILKRDGYEATHAQSGELGQVALREEVFDAMIVDLRLPDMRGDVFLHVAVSLQPHLLEHTLFITGDISPKADALVEAANCPMLRKPFDLVDVVSVMRKLAPQGRKEGMTSA